MRGRGQRSSNSTAFGWSSVSILIHSYFRTLIFIGAQRVNVPGSSIHRLIAAVYGARKPCLARVEFAKFFCFSYFSIFVCICQLVSNHRLIRLKRFVS
jgi:hypothetical protein